MAPQWLWPQTTIRSTSRLRTANSMAAVVLQLERLMGYPMVRRRVESGHLTLHGWHYVIEDGEIHVFDAQKGGFLAAADSAHAGTGPYRQYVEHDGQVLCD